MTLMNGTSLSAARASAESLADRFGTPYVLFRDTSCNLRMERLSSAPWVTDWLFVVYPRDWKGESYSLSWKDRIAKPGKEPNVGSSEAAR